MKFKFIQILLVITTTIFAQTPRSRVQIQNGTLVSDRGTLLRGARISTDGTSTFLPSREEVSNIKNLGLNCIHLYAECPQYQEPGENVALVDSMVKWTEIDSLYLIIVIGACNQNCHFDLNFVMDFWNLYAPRYKDKTHVIYEIANEPECDTAPFDTSTLNMEKKAYDIIRSLAPETHIMFMTYPGLDSLTLDDINYLGPGIDWSNASIAAHGFMIGTNKFRSAVHAVKNAGYAVTITETGLVQVIYANVGTTRIYEEEYISYAHFVTVQSLNEDTSVYKYLIENSDVRWEPDFGIWPENIPPVLTRDPYQSVIPTFWDEFNGVWNNDDGVIGQVSNNDYVAFYSFDFQEGPGTFNAVCSSGGEGGNIELHLDSINGLLIGTCIIPVTGNWTVYNTFSCATEQFNGINNLYLVFKGDNCCDLFNVKSFIFNRPGTNYIRPLNSSDNENIQIFPNPAHDYINVNMDENAVMEIYNVQGQLMISGKLSVMNNSIHLTNLSAGSYILKIINNTKVFSEIFIIE
jgi:hypothetical protein